MPRRAALVLFLGIVGFLGIVASDQDFNLLDALDDEKKTTPAPKKSFDEDFNLEDALGGGGSDNPANPNQPKPKPHPKPNPQPNPRESGNNGDFSDKDLLDEGHQGRGGGGGGGERPRKEEEEGTPQGVVPGIVGAVVVAVAGAVSSFIAYQKKKFCFKENAEQGEVDMVSRPSANTEPPVQQTLLEK